MSTKEKKSKKQPKPIVEDYDKNRLIVEAIAARPENNFCFDCNAHAPRWASINFGVFVCLRCSGFHRNLGVHISKVRSVNLDKWTLEQAMHMDHVGNKRGAEIYEARRPRSFRKPDEFADDRYMETYIRAKYEQKAFFALPSNGSDDSEPEEAQKRSSKDKKSKGKKDKKEKEKKPKKKQDSDSEEQASRPQKKAGESSSSDADSEPSEGCQRRAARTGTHVEDDFAAFGSKKAPAVEAPSATPLSNGSQGLLETNARQCRRDNEIEDEFMAFAPPKASPSPAITEPQNQFKSLQDEVFRLFES